jgi:hypothetical protein
MRKTALLAPLVLVAAALACNGINGVGDLQLVECATCNDAATAPAPTQDSGPPIVETTPRDGGNGALDVEIIPDDAATDGAVGKPTYCNGVTFYQPYEASTLAKIPAGQNIVSPSSGALTYTTGKYKQAAVYNNQQHFYSNAANAILNPNVGTFSVWFLPQFDLVGEPRRYFLRPRNAADNANGGPALTFQDDRAMMQVVNDGSPTALLNQAQTATYWTTAQYMLMVGTWDRNAPAGTPSLSVALYAPGQTMTATYVGTWTPEAGNAALFRIGNNASATLDEVIVWNRVLTKAEMDALSTAPKAMEDTCAP